VIRAFTVFLALLVFPATASAAGSGGTLAGPTARGFTASPATVAPGGSVTFALRATTGALVRVDVITPGQPAVRVRLGRVSAAGSVRGTWKVAVPAGKYTARLVVSGAGVTRYLRAALIVVAPAPPPPPAAPAAPASLSTTGSKVFPVQGPYSFGNEGARFGAGRTGHVHQGQDVVAAEGVPIVSPVAGTVHWIAYQAAGAGHYVVVAGADGRHYVFMHLQAGSIVVAKGAPIAAGQRLGAVGNSGASEGPHLHFEIWVNGWWASKASAPIDPLPELQVWAART
jgi:murein DD-endopeptidase MepM/ murein hydrolase activator NlpD